MNFYNSWAALGIGAASFWSVAEKDRAESPTALPERHKKSTDNAQQSTDFVFDVCSYYLLKKSVVPCL